MKNKQAETIIYSTVGVVALLIIILAINVIASAAKQRVDLTAEKAYTLSPGTKAILNKLDSRVTLRFYCSQGDEMPVYFKTYARRVEDLLAEYKQAGKGKIVIEKYNPTPDSDAEDSARLNGIEGQALQMGAEKIYLGLVVSLLDEKAALPFLAPDRERLLEYDLSRAIARVVTPKKPVVGVMSAFPVFGAESNPMMQRMGQQGSQPWVFLTELKNDFDVKQVELAADKIPDDINVLVVAHPRDITDAAQFAIDQFVLRGGKLIAFIDPMAYFDQQNNQFAQFGGGGGKSSLEKLLKAWGVEMESGKVAADRILAARNPQGGVMPSVLLMTKQGMNTNDIVTSELNSLVIPFPGVFTGTPAAGLKETVLLKTTTDSQLVDGLMASMSGEQISKEFKSSGKEYPLAIRLAGKFKTAFPDGKPKASEKPEDKTDEKKTLPAAGTFLKESAADNAVVLVADADMLQDQVSVEVQNFFGQRILRPLNDNLNFLQSLVEQLSGDANLINLRSRASMNRPFTRINEMRARADENYRGKIKEMEDSLAEAQRKLNELQQSKQSGQKFIMSPEQQTEIEKFRKKENEVKIALKEERKKLKKDTDALEFKTKVVNIAAMPIAVAVAGLALAIVKRKRTAAK
ncbi:MAG: GldG family protein [Verrucomicrobiota bacterium]